MDYKKAYMSLMGMERSDTVSSDGMLMDLGFVDRDGNIIVCDYGAHEYLACKICEEKGWEKRGKYTLYSDYLVYEKGYVLIDRPMFIASCTFAKILTDKQEEAILPYIEQGFRPQYIGDLSVFEGSE